MFPVEVLRESASSPGYEDASGALDPQRITVTGLLCGISSCFSKNLIMGEP
jgi:hypothetical protein